MANFTHLNYRIHGNPYCCLATDQQQMKHVIHPTLPSVPNVFSSEHRHKLLELEYLEWV